MLVVQISIQFVLYDIVELKFSLSLREYNVHLDFPL